MQSIRAISSSESNTSNLPALIVKFLPKNCRQLSPNFASIINLRKLINFYFPEIIKKQY